MDPNRRSFLLARRNAAVELHRRVAISSACLAQHGVECRICGDACDTGAIRMRIERGGAARPVLDQSRCTGCADCVGPCPVGAISVAPRE